MILCKMVRITLYWVKEFVPALKVLRLIESVFQVQWSSGLNTRNEIQQ